MHRGRVCTQHEYGLAGKAYPTTPPRNPGTSIPSNWMKVVLGPKGERVDVAFHFSNQAGGANSANRTYTAGRFALDMDYVYNPATGTVNQVPTPQESVEGAPIRGIIVKGGKNPGGNYAQRVIGDFDGDGVATFAQNLSPGSYDIAITIPAGALGTKAKNATATRSSG
jgi:hypothetical protein